MDELEQAKARVGTVVKSKWRLDALLGCGGMAAVYRATHRNGNEVAIKMLHPHLSVTREVRDRFLREGYVANKVKHPGALRILDDDVTDDGAAFLVMELLEGETLENRRIRLGGRLAPDEVTALGEQLLDVLVVAHQAGIVHRDLKPENLFMTEGGELKVLDFGIARIRELSSSSNATQAGSLLGTPAYMAPEQARGRWNDVDHQTDIWAVGASMYALITGSAVHEAETVSETLALAVTQRARPIRSAMPMLDPSLAALIDRALCYEKSERWPSAEAMRDALRVVRQAAAVARPAGRQSLASVHDYGEISQVSQVSAVAALPPMQPLDAPVAAPSPETTGKTTLTPGAMAVATVHSEPRFRLRLLREASPQTLMVIAAAAAAVAFALIIVVALSIRDAGSSDEAQETSPRASAVALQPSPEIAHAEPAPAATGEQTGGEQTTGEQTAAPPASASASSAAKPAPKPPRPKTPPPKAPKTPTASPDPWDIRGKAK